MSLSWAVIIHLILSYTTEHFQIVLCYQLRCKFILRPIIQCIKKKEPNILNVDIMHSLQALKIVCYSFSNQKCQNHCLQGKFMILY